MQQTEKSGAKFKILKCSKQTQSPFPQQSTLSLLLAEIGASKQEEQRASLLI
jgi:hypothetical protein